MNAGDISVVLAAAVAASLVGWFFIGAQMNVRHGHAALRWLRSGLPLICQRTSLRWMGTTGIFLTMNEASAPFKSVHIRIATEQREAAPLWLLTHLLGRRDMMIVQCDLRRQPRIEYDLLDQRTPAGKQALKRTVPAKWERSTLSSGLLAASDGPRAAAAALRVHARVASLAPMLSRLAVRSASPHLEAHLVAPWRSQLTSPAVLGLLKEIGDDLASS
jgi:hypothetical protein